MKLSKRVLAMLLAVLMLASMAPMTVMQAAAENITEAVSDLGDALAVDTGDKAAEPAETEPEEPPAPAASPESAEADALSPESLAEVLFRSTLPGPEEKEYFASLVGHTVEWSGTVRMAYEISSDFVFGNGKAVKVQMDICSVNGKYGRQTLRATAVFPPENYKEIRAMSNKTIRFRGSILKLEPFSREIYLSKGELL